MTFSDGSRIEIENGRFERKDPQGRTIEERPATAADRAMLANARSHNVDRRAGLGRARGGGVVASFEINGRDVEVTYVDGWKEEIQNGRYEMKDANNNTVVERNATQRDVDRLFGAFE
ncbi:hypothetical protein AVO45_09425 [Ruegeria marisrubri]|uniref:Uncharacterized protein n=1 Tax=Ruegeria marisrubri TaxID=1685379 RepID=A0A0X3TR91_9RHOB|nr:hypothetical protein AVO45_09425 [Ruegeria marisrubri]